MKTHTIVSNSENISQLERYSNTTIGITWRKSWARVEVAATPPLSIPEACAASTTRDLIFFLGTLMESILHELFFCGKDANATWPDSDELAMLSLERNPDGIHFVTDINEDAILATFSWFPQLSCERIQIYNNFRSLTAMNQFLA